MSAKKKPQPKKVAKKPATKAAKPKPTAKKAAKKAPKKAAKKAAPKNVHTAEWYSVQCYNTLLSFTATVKIGHPPKIGDVIFVKHTKYREKIRGVIVGTEPVVSCLLDPVADSKGSIIL